MQRPILARRARYRWDAVRGQHQLVFPEGVLVLNESGAAIVRNCDGRATADLVAVVGCQFGGVDRADEVRAFLARLSEKGLLREADDPPSSVVGGLP